MKKVRLSTLIFVEQREALDAHVKASGMNLTQVIGSLLDTLKIKVKKIK